MRSEDLSRYIGRDLSILTEKQRRIFQYRLEGKSNGEISKIEGMKKNAVVGNIIIAKHKLDGTYKQYSKNQKKSLKMSRIERGIKKIHNKYQVSISYRQLTEDKDIALETRYRKTPSKTKYIAFADSLEVAQKIRDEAEAARGCGEFETWYKNFIESGRKLT